MSSACAVPKRIGWKAILFASTSPGTPRAWERAPGRVTNREEFPPRCGKPEKKRGYSRYSAETEKYHFPPDSGVWWDVAVAEATQDSVTQNLRKEYEAARKLQKFHY